MSNITWADPTIVLPKEAVEGCKLIESLQYNFLLNTNIKSLVWKYNAIDYHHFIFNSNIFPWINNTNTESKS